MADPAPRNTQAGGVAIALCTMIGVIAGGLMGQASAGMLAGVAVGAAIAVAVWLVDRRRAG